ncbi:uncharacterized protein LOC142319937 [Lycorma delicatula]|uniref:uncharacterized protein LOC142319937 n=1 Tax=Lycorma delicatula TaxID=130591 RepID=UPI003F50DE05
MLSYSNQLQILAFKTYDVILVNITHKVRKIEDSPSLPRKGDSSWSPERVKYHHLSRLQARYDINQDPAMKINLQPSLCLRQTVWTNVEYCTECCNSQSSMPTWGPVHSLHGDELLRSCSQKLGTLKKQYKHIEEKKNKEKEKDKSIKKEMLKPKIIKSASEEIASPPAITTPLPGKKRIKRKTTRTKKITENVGSSITEEIKNDPNLHIEPIKVEEYKKQRDMTWKKPMRQPVARSRFRKGGIVATATVRTYAADQDNETDAEEEKLDNTSGSKKKKKKRKLLNLHKRVRKAIAAVTNKSSVDEKPLKQR